MASPIAHSLAGVIIYYASRRNDHRKPHESRELWWSILAANLADLDLIPSMLMGDHTLFHRTATHSLLGTALFGAFVLAVCWWRSNTTPVRTTFVLTSAYGSQLLLDWLSLDTGAPAGIPVFWPFSGEHYMADPTIFLNIERDNPFTLPIILHNAKAAAGEIGLLGPIALLAWWWRARPARV